MKAAVLIGLTYDQGIELKLPGTIVDLYLTYQLAIRARVDRIIIITDLVEANSTIITEAIIGEVARPDLFQFLDQIKTSGIYQPFTSKADLIQTLTLISSQYQDVLIYYSGHGDQRSLILPSLERLPMTGLIDPFDREHRLVIIMDCCNGTDCELPYQYQRQFRLVRTKFIRPKVLVLSASQPGESSYSTNCGSTFTRCLSRCLGLIDSAKRPKLNLGSLVDQLRTQYHDSTLNVYASHPSFQFWTWLLGWRLEVKVLDGEVLIRRNDH